MAEVADPEEGLRVESASRLDWDRDRWLRRPLNAVVNPVKADSEFMSKLLFLLRKVSQPGVRHLLLLLSVEVHPATETEDCQRIDDCRRLTALSQIGLRVPRACISCKSNGVVCSVLAQREECKEGGSLRTPVCVRCRRTSPS